MKKHTLRIVSLTLLFAATYSEAEYKVLMASWKSGGDSTYASLDNRTGTTSESNPTSYSRTFTHTISVSGTVGMSTASATLGYSHGSTETLSSSYTIVAPAGTCKRVSYTPENDRKQYYIFARDPKVYGYLSKYKVGSFSGTKWSGVRTTPNLSC